MGGAPSRKVISRCCQCVPHLHAKGVREGGRVTDLQTSSVMRFLCKRSLRRPGVATMMWQPLLTMSICCRTSIPPTESIASRCGYPDPFSTCVMTSPKSQ